MRVEKLGTSLRSHGRQAQALTPHATVCSNPADSWPFDAWVPYSTLVSLHKSPPLPATVAHIRHDKLY